MDLKNRTDTGMMLQPLTLVLVTDQFKCERLIRAGRQMADRDGTTLEVINVAAVGAERNPEAIEYLYRISKENDAVMMIHYSDEPARFITQLIRECCPSNVVTGLPQKSNSMLHKIWMRFEQISFFTVDHDGILNPVTLRDRVIA